eukprot:7387416-Prymnesium_polylepis.3
MSTPVRRGPGASPRHRPPTAPAARGARARLHAQVSHGFARVSRISDLTHQSPSHSVSPDEVDLDPLFYIILDVSGGVGAVARVRACRRRRGFESSSLRQYRYTRHSTHIGLFRQNRLLKS